MAKQKTDEQGILEASLRLFRQKSFHATSMADIAEACGLQKGSLYHYFSSKEELMQKVIALVHGFFNDQVFSIAYDESIEDPIERLDQMLQRTMRIFVDKETGEMLGNVGVETALVIPEFQPIIRAFFDDFFRAVRHVYEHKYPKDVAHELAERAVAEIEGSLVLSRIFEDNHFIMKTHQRLLARLR